ncbi:MAG: 1,4-dihydroxy-6-naphthoate synthase [Chitinophagales bacterium]|nr:1,4-dihydroxy-6-naphthoate synthase [Chitinophagales bacterium]
MKLTIGFSPCPNDTFILDAMLHGKIDCEGLVFDIVMEDVETLNRFALNSILDISKLSYHAYAYVSENYQLLLSGSALGSGCGPLLISKDEIPLSQVEYCVIGIPGKFTTANLLLSIAFPDALTKKEMIFSSIEKALLNGEIDAGAIIHENRFTYEKKGLRKIMDLGAYWEKNYAAPIPLGGIAIKRSVERNVQEKVNRVLRRSIEFALQDPAESLQYVLAHASEMDREIVQQHIDLYVNNFTIDLGEEGKHAVEKLYEIASGKKIIPSLHYPVFI